MTSSSTPTRGVIFAATGAPYLEIAIRAARSVKKHNPNLPVCLFTDQEDDSGVFDQVILLEAAHIRSKVNAIQESPYEETLYLDCDVIIRENIEHMFDLLENYDICLAHVVLWHRPGHQDNFQVSPPECFCEPNTGVILYHKRDHMKDFLQQWHDDFYAYGSNNDQVTMRELLWTSDVRYYTLPEQYNKRVFEASELIYSDRPRAKIFHLQALLPKKNPIARWFSNRIR